MREHRDTKRTIAALALSLVVLLSVVTAGTVTGSLVASAAADGTVDVAETPSDGTDGTPTGAEATTTAESATTDEPTASDEPSSDATEPTTTEAPMTEKPEAPATTEAPMTDEPEAPATTEAPPTDEPEAPATTEAPSTAEPTVDAQMAEPTTTEALPDDDGALLIARAEPVADFEYADLRVSPTEAAVNETVSIAVTVTNVGSVEGTFTGPLFVDGVRVDAASEPIAPGETENVTYGWASDRAGSFAVGVGDLSPVTVNLTAVDKGNETDGNATAGVEYANLSVSPTTVAVNGTVDVTVTVSNPGNETADYVAELLVDGTAVDQQPGSLGAGNSTDLASTWSPATAGTYEVTVGDLTAQTVTVEAESEPVPRVIDDCTTITEPGVYELTADVTRDAETCIAVLASDVVIEGNGHVIDGVSGAEKGPRTDRVGLYVAPVLPGASDDGERLSNVTVRNLSVTGWGHGIHLSGVDDATIERVSARANRVGLYAESAPGLDVSQSTVESSTRHGMRLKWSEDVEVVDSTFADQGFRGIFASGSSSVTIAGNTFDGDQVGLRFKSGTNSSIRDNTFVSEAIGVDVMMSGNVTVRGNGISAGTVGVFVNGVDDHADGDDGHDDDDHTDDHGVDDGHEDDGHTDDHGVDDGHTDDSGASGGSHAAQGPVEVSGNHVADADTGLRLDGGSNVTLFDNTFENIGNWTVYAGNGSHVEPMSQVTLAGTPMSAHGQDVAISTPGSVPADPPGYASVGRYVTLSMTSAHGWVELAIPYAPGHLPRGADEADLRLWLHDGTDWRMADSPVWAQTDGAWTLTGSNAVDTERRMVSANVSDPGVVGLFAGPTPDPEAVPRVENASVEPARVQPGEPAVAAADVHNDGPVAVPIVVDLVVDGSVAQSQVVDVGPGSVERVSFNISPGTAGSYEVAIGSVHAGTLSAVAPSGGSERRSQSGGSDWRPSAAGSDVASPVEATPASDGGVEARVTARARVPTTLDLGALDADPTSGVRLESMEVTTNRDLEYDLQARTGLLGDPAQPAFEARLGEPIEYVEFRHSFEDDAVDGADISFAVPRSRVDNPASVSLYRFHDGAWHRLKTILVGESGAAYVYEASTPGLSTFAVVSDRPVAPEIAVDVLESGHYGVGEPVPVSTAVHNPSRAPMTFAVDLRVDGEVVDIERVTIGPGRTTRVTFEHALEAAGARTLSVGGITAGTVTVDPAPAAGTRVTETAAGTAEPTATGSDGGGAAWIPLTVALALAVVVLLGTGFALRRRR